MFESFKMDGKFPLSTQLLKKPQKQFPYISELYFNIITGRFVE